MGDCGENSKRIAPNIEESSSASLLSKRRRVDFGYGAQLELRLPLSSSSSSVNVELNDQSHCRSASNSPPPATAATSTSSGGAGDLCSEVSRCSCSNDYCYSGEIVDDKLRFVDPEAKSFETENSTYPNSNIFSREATPTSEVCGDSEEMDFPAKKSPVVMTTKKTTHRGESLPPPAAKMPSQAEIDEFLNVAEKYEQQKFTEKYNFDIVKDVPLDGRYEWVRLNNGNP